MSKTELLNMIRFGADAIFNAEGNDYTEEVRMRVPMGVPFDMLPN